jgi:hypothetical protein
MTSGNVSSKTVTTAFLLLGLILLSGCGSIFPQPTPTATLVPTATLKPSATPRPTSTPRPTNTPTPTPAPVGTTITYGNLEITVLGVKNRESVHFGDITGNMETFYKPRPGNFLIDVGVLVHNLKPDHVERVKWGDVFIVDQDGSWYPIWGNSKAVTAGKVVDPFSVGLSSVQTDPDAYISFNEDTYLRLIFGTSDDPEQTLLFGIEDSAKITFTPSD